MIWTPAAGGGWGRIKNACVQLLRRGVDAEELFRGDLESGDTDAALSSLDGRVLDESIRDWMSHLQTFGVYFASGLDLDMLMLKSFPDDYRRLTDGQTGPREGAEVAKQAAAAVLGAEATPHPTPRTLGHCSLGIAICSLGGASPTPTCAS